MEAEFKFLEISIPSADVRASLEWYRALGFTELATGDIRNYHYAVVSDGELCLGLHAEGLTQAGLTFVRQELATYVRRAQSSGVEFDTARLGVDDFHEAIRHDPVGNPVVLIEARTFSSAHTSDPVIVGTLNHIALPCMNVDASLTFWEQYGFISVQADSGEPAELHAPGLTLQLQNGIRELGLHFHNNKLAATLEALSLQGIDARQTPDGLELRAPEGTRLIMESSS